MEAVHNCVLLLLIAKGFLQAERHENYGDVNFLEFDEVVLYFYNDYQA